MNTIRSQKFIICCFDDGGQCCLQSKIIPTCSLWAGPGQSTARGLHRILYQVKINRKICGAWIFKVVLLFCCVCLWVVPLSKSNDRSHQSCGIYNNVAICSDGRLFPLFLHLSFKQTTGKNATCVPHVGNIPARCREKGQGD